MTSNVTCDDRILKILANGKINTKNVELLKGSSNSLTFYKQSCNSYKSYNSSWVVSFTSCCNAFRFCYWEFLDILEILEISLLFYYCAQVNGLPQSSYGDNREGTLFSWLHIYYAHLISVRFEHSVCFESLNWPLNTCILYIIYIHIIYIIYIYNIYIYSIYIYKFFK